MKAASIIADVQRLVAMSQTRTPSASAASAISAHRPELMIARGSALTIQAPILTADTNRESASVAYATIVKSMADHPLGPSTHLLAASPLRSAHPNRFRPASGPAQTCGRLFLDRAGHRRDVVRCGEGVGSQHRQRADTRARSVCGT